MSVDNFSYNETLLDNFVVESVKILTDVNNINIDEAMTILNKSDDFTDYHLNILHIIPSLSYYIQCNNNENFINMVLHSTFLASSFIKLDDNEDSVKIELLTDLCTNLMDTFKLIS